MPSVLLGRNFTHIEQGSIDEAPRLGEKHGRRAISNSSAVGFLRKTIQAPVAARPATHRRASDDF